MIVKKVSKRTYRVVYTYNLDDVSDLVLLRLQLPERSLAIEKIKQGQVVDTFTHYYTLKGKRG